LHRYPFAEQPAALDVEDKAIAAATMAMSALVFAAGDGSLAEMTLEQGPHPAMPAKDRRPIGRQLLKGRLNRTNDPRLSIDRPLPALGADFRLGKETVRHLFKKRRRQKAG